MLRGFREWIVSPAGVMAWSRFMPGLGRLQGRAPLSDLTQVRHLGVLRPDGLGDIVLTTGMLRELRRQLPAAHITLICQAHWATWMRTCPWVDDVVDVAMTSSGNFREQQRFLEMLRFVRRVWPLELDVLIHPGTLYWYVPSRALAWFSGAPVRLCWEDPGSGAETGGAFYTQTLPYPNSWHETEKCFRMLDAIGLDGSNACLATWWTAEDARRGGEIARAARKTRHRLVALGLASSEPQKRWPRDRYLEVIREIGSGGDDVAFVALGGRDVADTCRWLSQQIPEVVTYPGENIPLGAVWAAIAECDLYLGNDSGLMHMAAAARVPVVAIIGVAEEAQPGTRGDARQTGPFGTASRIVRPAAGTSLGAALDAGSVPTDAVLKATLELLEESRPKECEAVALPS